MRTTTEQTEEPELGLHEQLVLLLLDDERGTVEGAATWYPYALAGGIVSELLLNGSLTLAREGKKQWVDVARHRPVHDEVLDEALTLIRDSKRRTLGDWLHRLSSRKDPRHRIAAGLCRRGILDDRTDKVLLVFNRRVYPTVDSGPETRLVATLQQIIESNDSPSDRDRSSLGLAQAADLLKIPFDRQLLADRRQRIEDLAASDPVAVATRELVQTVQIAATVIIVS